VDEKQKGNTKAGVECPQCGTSYVIRFPQPTFFVAFLDSGDLLVQRLCPIITGGVCVGSIYWTCVTFGAVTLMQTVGHDRSLVLMERADPMLLLVSLPLVPVGLIIGQMIRWEEAVSIENPISF
jgi:E3 ubiquitin-protein ligase MARCH5